MQREQLHAGLELRRLREQRVHVLGADRLDVGDLAAAEDGERLLGDISTLFVSRPVLSLMALNSFLAFVGRVRTSGSLRRSLMLIVLTMRAGSGRARSIDSSPFFRSALSTSMPSASTKVRWNWRAAMPRWRYCRLLSSCWRPRMTSCFSSTVTSS